MSTREQRVVVLPTYNSGRRLAETLAAVAAAWSPVWVVSDGSTDNSVEQASALRIPGVEIHRLEANSGKGTAVLHALKLAAERGFDHALVMDADGQHDAASVPRMMALSEEHPGCLIAGIPEFGADAPRERVIGRRAGNTLALVETLGRGARDSLFGMRVYPVAPMLRIFSSIRGGRRFDFDTVAAVRMAWSGVPTVNVRVPVRYPAASDGGVSHFKYVRDNMLLAAAHARLLLEMPAHITRLAAIPPCR